MDKREKQDHYCNFCKGLDKCPKAYPYEPVCADFEPCLGYKLAVVKSHDKVLWDSHCNKCRYYKDNACYEGPEPTDTEPNREACYWFEEEFYIGLMRNER